MSNSNLISEALLLAWMERQAGICPFCGRRILTKKGKRAAVRRVVCRSWICFGMYRRAKGLEKAPRVQLKRKKLAPLQLVGGRG